jgi:flagellar motor switch protein FliN/FliY
LAAGEQNVNDRTAQQNSTPDVGENRWEDGNTYHETGIMKTDRMSDKNFEPDELSPAAFQNLTDMTDPVQEEPRTNAEELNLDVILDVPVTISMEIGHTRINIRNLLQLNQGSVVELDRLAGEPMDVLVNGTLIAHGEVVVVNDKFGIRLTDVISAAERVKKLQ